jgi:hypothetical protein
MVVGGFFVSLDFFFFCFTHLTFFLSCSRLSLSAVLFLEARDGEEYTTIARFWEVKIYTTVLRSWEVKNTDDIQI